MYTVIVVMEKYANIFTVSDLSEYKHLYMAARNLQSVYGKILQINIL